MLRDILTIARNWSLILLVLQGLIISLAVLFLLYKVTSWLGKLVRKFVPFMRQIQAKFIGVMTLVQRVMAALRAPFIWIWSIGDGLRAGLTGVRRILWGGR